MKKFLALGLLCVSLQLFADDPVRLKTLSCEATRAPLKTGIKANVHLNGQVRLQADGTYQISYKSYIEFLEEDGSHRDFEISQSDKIEHDVKYQPTKKYKDYIRFNLDFGGEEVEYIFPKEFKTHGAVTSFLRLHGFQDSASGTIRLNCR